MVDPADSFENCRVIKDALATGAVALVRAAWLLELSNGEGRLPRRQDMPEEAFWNPNDLFDGVQLRTGHEIAAVSYCWHTREHPDPTGAQLKTLCHVIKSWNQTKFGLLVTRIAVFIDWCSIVQCPRSAKDELLFQEALRYSAVWFAHPYIHVWMMTNTPDGVLPYKERGWPTFEKTLSALTSRHSDVLDIGRLESGIHYLERGWPSSDVAVSALIQANIDSFDGSGMKVCAMQRDPFLSPEEFTKVLSTKTFCHRADFQLLKEIYARTFQTVANSVEILDFSGQEWGDWEMDKISDALPSFTRLTELNLANNEITDLGLSSLAKAVPFCRSLRCLYLTNNDIEAGLEGAESLRDAWRSSNKDDFGLFLSYPTQSDFVQRKLST